MTEEFAINILEQYREKPTLINEIETVEEAVWLDEALSMAIQALKQEPCEVAISREAVLQAVNKGCQEWHGIYSRCEELINALPPVKPQEPYGDAISRKSIKHKLQEHHDFFVNAYGGFSNLPQNDKSRVDEITNCIAMVVNEPSVKPQESEE